MTSMKLAAAATALALTALPAAAAAPKPAPAPADPASEVRALAAEAVRLQLNYDPSIAYFTGLKAPAHDRLPDRTPKGLRAFERGEDAVYAKLARVDATRLAGSDRATYAVLREQLEADRGLRVCKAELWAVDHFNGWQLNLPQVADQQPVTTPAERAAALKRWGALPAFIDVEIANLKAGLAQGYSAPKSVTERVIKQIDGLLTPAPDKSAFYAPAEHSNDPAFKAAFRTLVQTKIDPALKRYRDFLANDYMPRARDTLGLSALPRGVDCYRAYLRTYTTLDRPPEAVYRLGQETVAENLATVKALGRKDFGTDDFVTIVQKVTTSPDNRFASEAELVAYSKAAVERSRKASADWFVKLPSQVMLVEPFPPYMRGSGVSSHYDPNPDPKKPAAYRINLDNWRDTTRSDAQITAFHEGWPGHHLQMATAATTSSTGDIGKLGFNSAYVEGWARYAERLSEEMGLYQGDYALIARRTWPARGMVVDPGIHLYGWTREQAADYMAETGRFNRAEAEAAVDRIAAMPGQLTAYDSGGLEIVALREQARAELGDRFDIREFHQAVLEEGVVPLPELRAHVQAWIARKKAG